MRDTASDQLVRGISNLHNHATDGVQGLAFAHLTVLFSVFRTSAENGPYVFDGNRPYTLLSELPAIVSVQSCDLPPYRFACANGNAQVRYTQTKQYRDHR